MMATAEQETPDRPLRSGPVGSLASANVPPNDVVEGIDAATLREGRQGFGPAASRLGSVMRLQLPRGGEVSRYQPKHPSPLIRWR